MRFALALSAFSSLAAAAWGQDATLAQAAAKAGLNIGIATNSRNVNGSANAAYLAAAKSQFNMVVCENEMKFQPTEPQRGKFNYAGGDAVYEFAQANGMRMRGHTFIWHSQSGFAESFGGNRAEMLGIMKTHIDSVGGHFKEKILEWDVLNEITADGGGLRGTNWRTRIGDDYPDSALVHARKVIGKSGFLYYNDYGAEGMNTKANSVYNLVRKWIENKVPIDGIGLQCHLSAGFNAKDVSANIKRLGELGLRVSLTEVDIKNGTSQDWVNLMNACLENFNCVSFVAWGLSDANSWLGSNCDCLMYDGQYKAKAHVQALLGALGKADPTVAAKRIEFANRNSSIRSRMAGKRPRAGRDAFRNGPTPLFASGAEAFVDVSGRERAPILPGPKALGLSAR